MAKTNFSKLDKITKEFLLREAIELLKHPEHDARYLALKRLNEKNLSHPKE